MFYMTSKEFQDIYLVKENDQDILDTQYVLVSYRITHKGVRDNVINASQLLFPSNEVWLSTNDADFKTLYKSQLSNATSFLATIIKASIIDKYTFVFMCTKKEGKFNYFPILAEYIIDEFHYPLYEYKAYKKHPYDIAYSKSEVLTLCDEYMIEASEKYYLKQASSYDGVMKIIDNLKTMSKHELRYRLEAGGIDTEGMSRKEMLKYAKDVLMSQIHYTFQV